MPQYKLHYFNLRGRAELARLIMHYAGVEFEDARFERSDWPQHKAKMPFGQVPVLEVDGKMLAQSHTICRYLARQHGLAGKCPWEEALADMYVDCIGDLINAMRPAFLEKDPEKKKELNDKFMAEHFVPHLEKIEKHLEANGTGFLVGSEMTWADLAYFAYLDFFGDKLGEILSSAPNLKALHERVGNVPAIKKWVEERPKTEM